MHSVEITIYHLFSRDAKKKYSQIIEKCPKCLTCFKKLSTSPERHGDFFDQLEEFVCFVYGTNVKSINNVRWKKFDKKLQREHKVADLASLPPFKQVFLYHTVPEIKDHGWLPNDKILEG